MNIHPAIVHFPIALLVVYSLMECIQWKAFVTHASWKDAKAIFVILGTLFGFASLQTGEIAGHAFGKENMRPLIELHATFATASVWIFCLLALVYIVMVVEEYKPALTQKRQWKFLLNASQFIRRPYIAIPLSLLGLVTITITGALGGALTYGPEVDPIVSFIYHLFY